MVCVSLYPKRKRIDPIYRGEALDLRAEKLSQNVGKLD